MDGVAQEPLIVIPTQEELDKIRGYRIGKWHQYKNYECIYCQFSTLWIDKMEKHQAVNEHPWAYPVSSVERDNTKVSDDSEPSYE